MKQKLLCKKDFNAGNFGFIAGKYYDYWTNFEGLNHFISDGVNYFPFDGQKDQYENLFNSGTARDYIYDFFYTKEEHRELKINEIISKDKFH